MVARAPKTLLFACVLMSLGAGGGALAADQAAGKNDVKAGIENVMKSCKGDIDKFCSEITPGDGRLAACLMSRSDKLSSDCNDARKGLRDVVSQKLDQAELKVRKSCGGDIQKYCSDVPSGGGRIYECLNEHTGSLSKSCGALQAKVDKRLKDVLG